MISCRHASELMSQQLDRPLKLGEKLQLRAHLLICKSCPKTLEQFDILHQAGQHYPERLANQTDRDAGLSKEAKQRILNTIRDRDSDSQP
ncbi:MAG: zf-HC2 domain-containing protein [Gammaproteobacteria bacterium]|nr:zf-HC2 domain-containing protein [Gammaproteobacteria bacterium]